MSEDTDSGPIKKWIAKCKVDWKNPKNKNKRYLISVLMSRYILPELLKDIEGRTTNENKEEVFNKYIKNLTYMAGMNDAVRAYNYCKSLTFEKFWGRAGGGAGRVRKRRKYTNKRKIKKRRLSKNRRLSKKRKSLKKTRRRRY